MSDDEDLELLAELGRREVDDKARKGEADEVRTAAKEERRSRVLERRSLGLPRDWELSLLIVSLSACAAAMLLVFVGITEEVGWWIWPLALFLLVGAVGIHLWTSSYYPAAQLRWLNSLPFEFDVQAYLAMLAERHYGRKMMVVVTFKEPVEAEVAKTLELAVSGALKGATGRVIHGNTLIITGRAVRTWFLMGRTESIVATPPIHDNSNLHAEFRTCVLRCLGPISRRVPIQKVTVRAPLSTD